MAPAASKADVAEQLGQAGSIPVRLRQPPGPAGIRPGRRRWICSPGSGGAVARIPLISADDEDADPRAREILRKVRESRGREINV